MNANLKFLLEYWESKIKILSSEIESCLEEWDYESAMSYTKSLHIAKAKLKQLSKLDDTNKLRRRIKRQLEILKKRLEKEDLDSIKKFSTERTNASIQKLEQKFHLDSQEIDDLIYKLLEQRISGFKIHLIKKDNFYIQLALFDIHILQISLTELSLLKDDDWVRDFHLKNLARLGFEHDKQSGQTLFKYNLKKFENTFEIKILLARIICEVYNPRYFDRPILLEYY